MNAIGTTPPQRPVPQPKVAANAEQAGAQPKDLAREKIKKLSQEFESIFLNLMLSAMRKSVPKSELMDGGNGEEIFRSMLDQEYAKSMAQRDMTGLARAIEASLIGKPALAKSITKLKGQEAQQAYKAQSLPEALK